MIGPLGTIDFWFSAEGRRVHKRVHHYLLEATGGTLTVEGDPDQEAIDVAWVPLDDLGRVLDVPQRAQDRPGGDRPPGGHARDRGAVVRAAAPPLAGGGRRAAALAPAIGLPPPRRRRDAPPAVPLARATGPSRQRAHRRRPTRDAGTTLTVGGTSGHTVTGAVLR